MSLFAARTTTAAAARRGVATASTRRLVPAMAAAPPPRRYATSTESGPNTSAPPPPPPTTSNTSTRPTSSSSMQVGPLFLTLVASGLLITTYGLYSYYTSFSTWPKPIANDLRAAIKARRAGEYRKAERKFRAALETARGMSEEELRGTGPKEEDAGKLMKTTGIAVALASMLEEEAGGGRALCGAYDVYLEAWKDCLTAEQSVTGRSGPERARAVALSQKLGQVALRIAEVPDDAGMSAVPTGEYAQHAVKALGDGKDSPLPPPTQSPLPTQAAAKEAAERHLVWTVEELLRLAIPGDVQARAKDRLDGDFASSSQGAPGASATTVSLSDLDLPPWLTRVDLLSSLESLGTFYASQGQVEYAVPLYLQALGMLMPPASSSNPTSKPQPKPTVADRCHAAVIMNNLSQVFLEGQAPNDDETRKAQAAAGGKVGVATSWAKKGLDIVQSVNKQVGWDLNSPPEAPSQRPLEYGDDANRLEQVRSECLGCEVALLVNLGALASLSGDKCDARSYLQRAWRLADREGMRGAKGRAGSLLRGLERFGTSEGGKK
ncbi:hypothetical protein BDZ90DRAFT_232338 [Jaminaea rosea]|uniref:TPR-like protein n=1 Tax=Jaminaea rosea TaxID=1569628 RepID=A0A316UPX9_9BASI|nr:hypothetical protein BDZ90DRAFT_232338 [Jaminaea rosea]PWN27359.1 hypothetical protein BDZ90DRAFT_232338 [Jaminaea rosea]